MAWKKKYQGLAESLGAVPKPLQAAPQAPALSSIGLPATPKPIATPMDKELKKRALMGLAKGKGF